MSFQAENMEELNIKKLFMRTSWYYGVEDASLMNKNREDKMIIPFDDNV